MEYADFLKSVRQRIQAAISRVEALARPLTDEQLSRQPEPGVWGVGQIIEHLALSLESYDPVLPGVVNSTPAGTGSVSHTRFGNLIIKACQPGASSPVPKPFLPVASKYDQAVIDRFVAVHQRMLTRIDEASGKDLIAGKVPVPLMKLFKMNLADIFEIAAAHAEYHLAQIEQRLPKD